MKCSQCQVQNSDHRSFCRQCGIQLMSHCPHCGFGNGWDDFYCGGCGRKLSAAAETAPADRTPRTASSKTSSSRTTLADLLREEPTEVKEKVAEEKKVMTQEEIDKLFKL